MFIPDARAQISKPRGAARVDWSHPLTNGLQFAVLFGDAVAVDLVCGYPSTPTNTPRTTAVAELGWGAAFTVPAAGTAYHVFNGLVADAQYLGPLSILWRGMLTQGGVFHDLVIKTVTNGSANTAFDFRTDTGTPPHLVLIRSNAAGSDTLTAVPTTTLNTVQTYGATSLGTNVANAVVFYINGVSNTPGGIPSHAPYTGNAAALQIGRRPDGAVQLIGSALLCYIWSRVLSNAEMLALHQNPYAFIARKDATVVYGQGILSHPASTLGINSETYTATNSTVRLDVGMRVGSTP